MKTALKIMVVFLFSTYTNQLAAASQLTFEYKYEYTMSFMLKMEGLQNEQHYIRIKDENGTVLFNEKSANQNKFHRMYNLKNLPSGTYTVIVENEHKIVIQPILMNGRFLKIETTAQKEVYKPTLTLKASTVVINMLHFEKSPILLTLKDKYHEVVYCDEFKAYGSLNKRLNMAKLPAENYLLEITTENYTVVKNINAAQQKIKTIKAF